jgi:hypothetical protein
MIRGGVEVVVTVVTVPAATIVVCAEPRVASKLKAQMRPQLLLDKKTFLLLVGIFFFFFLLLFLLLLPVASCRCEE